MTARHEQQVVERWVNTITYIGYFVFGAIVFSALFMGIVAIVGWATQPEWLDELFSVHYGKLLIGVSVLGGAVGVLFNRRLTRHFFRDHGPLD